MRTKIRNILQIIGIFLLASCNREEITGGKELPSDDKIAVNTEISVDGIEITDTRAATEAGYTTGDGLYDKGDQATVAAFANDGYELVRFYDKGGNVLQQDGSSYTFGVTVPQTFKAEFRKVANYTVSVSASPSAGGSVTGGGSYKGGISCTVTATLNSGYVLDGWYEGSSKVSSDASYTFTVSSNRTLTAKFAKAVGVYYFSSSNESYGTVSQSIAIIEDWRYLDEQSGAINVATNPKSGYYFNGWIVKTPGSNSYEEVAEGWVDDRGTLTMNDSRVADDYPSGSDFKAVFSTNPIRPEYTVTINIAEWRNNTWSATGDYSVYWYPGTANGTYSITKKYKEGDICTFSYAAGGDSSGQYVYRGVKDANRNAVLGINDSGVGISFTVTKDVTYYVEMLYDRN